MPLNQISTIHSKQKLIPTRTVTIVKASVHYLQSCCNGTNLIVPLTVHLEAIVPVPVQLLFESVSHQVWFTQRVSSYRNCTPWTNHSPLLDPIYQQVQLARYHIPASSTRKMDRSSYRDGQIISDPTLYPRGAVAQKFSHHLINLHRKTKKSVKFRIPSDGDERNILWQIECQTISFVPMAEGDLDISPWTLSYAQDQGCKAK